MRWALDFLLNVRITERNHQTFQHNFQVIILSLFFVFLSLSLFIFFVCSIHFAVPFLVQDHRYVSTQEPERSEPFLFKRV